MKRFLILFIQILFFSLSKAQDSSKVSYEFFGKPDSIIRGSISNLDKVTKLNISYDFSDFVVSARSLYYPVSWGYYTEAGFLERKVKILEEGEKGLVDKYLKTWSEAKEFTAPAKFEETFNKWGKEINMSGINNGVNAEYNLVIKTRAVFTGFQLMATRVPPYIDAEFIFTDNTGNELLRVFLKGMGPFEVTPIDKKSVIGYLPTCYAKAARTIVNLIKNGRRGLKVPD